MAAAVYLFLFLQTINNMSRCTFNLMGLQGTNRGIDTWIARCETPTGAGGGYSRHTFLLRASASCVVTVGVVSASFVGCVRLWASGRDQRGRRWTGVGGWYACNFKAVLIGPVVSPVLLQIRLRTVLCIWWSFQLTL